MLNPGLVYLVVFINEYTFKYMFCSSGKLTLQLIGLNVKLMASIKFLGLLHSLQPPYIRTSQHLMASVLLID